MDSAAVISSFSLVALFLFLVALIITILLTVVTVAAWINFDKVAIRYALPSPPSTGRATSRTFHCMRPKTHFQNNLSP